MIKAIIFDMDGLLIDSEPLWREAEMKIFPKVGHPLTEDDCRKTMGLKLPEVIDHWYNIKSWANISKIDLENLILSTVGQLIEDKGTPLPGVFHCMEVAKKLNLKIGLASSSPFSLIKKVLKKLQLESSFEAVVSAEDLPFGKPHPQVFLNCADKLGIKPVNCLVIEDSFHGMISGLAAKMKVVVVPEPINYSNPKFLAATAIVDSLEKITPSLIASLR